MIQSPFKGFVFEYERHLDILDLNCRASINHKWYPLASANVSIRKNRLVTAIKYFMLKKTVQSKLSIHVNIKVSYRVFIIHLIMVELSLSPSIHVA